jgi:hypothetical protein
MKYIVRQHTAELATQHLPVAIAGNCPVIYRVPLLGELAKALECYATKQHVNPETIIAEAVRAYLGADA